MLPVLNAPREPYYLISEPEGRKKLISELRNNLVFVMEWTAIGEEGDPKDCSAGSEEGLEASEKYSELFAACVVSLMDSTQRRIWERNCVHWLCLMMRVKQCIPKSRHQFRSLLSEENSHLMSR